MREWIPRPRLVSRTTVAAASSLIALVVPAPAIASHEPFAFADAQRGSLRVVSAAFVAPGVADLRGVWFDETLACDERRTLRVNVVIDYSRGSATRSVSRRRTGVVRNCAEGGPNFGFTLRARRVGLACPNGRWKRGFYTFIVRTTERATGLRATVSLGWDNRERCSASAGARLTG